MMQPIGHLGKRPAAVVGTGGHASSRPRGYDSRTPFPMAVRLVPYLREHELKSISKSKNVTGPIAQAAKLQLNRKAR